MASMARGKYWSGAIFNLAGVVCLSLVSLISTPLLINLMGDETFALFRIAVVSVVSFAFLLDMGMSGSVKRFMGNAINNDNEAKQHQYMGLALMVYGPISLLAFFGVLSTGYWLPGYLNVPEELIYDLRVLLGAVAIYVAFLLLQSVGNNIFVVYGRFDIIQTINVSGRFVHMFGTAAIIALFGYPLIAAAFITVLVSFFTLVSTLLVLRKLWVGWGVTIKGLAKEEIHNFFSLSGYGLLIAIGPVVLYYGQDFIVSKGFGLDQLVFYVPALIITTQLRVVLSSFASPVFTIASRLQAKGDTYGLANLMRVNIERSFFIWLIMACPIIVMSESILRVWMGERFAFTHEILTVMLVGVIGMVLYLVPFHILNACGKLKAVALSAILMVILFLLLCWISVDIIGMGLVCVAASMAVAMLTRGIFVFSTAAIEYKFYTIKNIFVYLLKLALACTICFSFSYFTISFIDLNDIAELLIGTTISFTISVATAFILLLSREDKHAISIILQNRLERREKL